MFVAARGEGDSECRATGKQSLTKLRCGLSVISCALTALCSCAAVLAECVIAECVIAECVLPVRGIMRLKGSSEQRQRQLKYFD